jgi:hypothetical protein
MAASEQPQLPTMACFCWNSGGLKICGTDNRTSTTPRPSITECINPRFITKFIKKYVNGVNYRRLPANIVAISTEEESEYGSYFHSTYLPATLVDFQLYQSVETSNVGEIYSTQVSGGTLGNILTGSPQSTALRLSVYVRKSYWHHVSDERDRLTSISLTHKSSQGPYMEQTDVLPRRMMGNVGVALDWKNFGSLTILAFALGMAPIKHKASYGRFTIENAVLDDTERFVSRVLENTTKKYQEAVVLMGDFATSMNGFRVIGGAVCCDYMMKILRSYTPTGKLSNINWPLRRGRPSGDSSSLDTSVNEGDPSVWGSHDRYFVSSYHPYSKETKEYSWYDMSESDHAGLILRLEFFDSADDESPPLPNSSQCGSGRELNYDDVYDT